MKLHLAILCITTSLLPAEEPQSMQKQSPIALLPDGSVLQNVLLPRYDAQHNLIGDLKVETMTLIDGDRVQGDRVFIRFYNPDRSKIGEISLATALFNHKKSVLTAHDSVEIASERLMAQGSGLVFTFHNGQGFLNGPVTTWIPAAPATTMNRKSSIFPAAAIALSLATSHAAPPAYVTAEELAEIKADAAPMEPKISSENISAESRFTKDSQAGEEAAEAAHSFIAANKIRMVDNKKTTQQAEPNPKPLAVQPTADDTVITCDGGMYFDSEEAILVYLGNVKVSDPRFDINGAQELKIFFEKRTTPNKKAESEKKDGLQLSGTAANFGNVQKLVANGAVRIFQKAVDGKDPVEASGAVLTYNVPKGEIIIHGGYPWVKQGKFYARAKQPNLTLRLLNNGSFSTQGDWEMGGNLNLKGK